MKPRHAKFTEALCYVDGEHRKDPGDLIVLVHACPHSTYLNTLIWSATWAECEVGHAGRALGDGTAGTDHGHWWIDGSAIEMGEELSCEEIVALHL